MKKFTFKKHPHDPWHKSMTDIKLQGCCVGLLMEQDDGRWGMSFMVEKDDPGRSKNPACSWRWISLKARADSEEGLRKMLVKLQQPIQEKYNLHKQED